MRKGASGTKPQLYTINMNVNNQRKLFLPLLAEESSPSLVSGKRERVLFCKDKLPQYAGLTVRTEAFKGGHLLSVYQQINSSLIMSALSTLSGTQSQHRHSA